MARRPFLSHAFSFGDKTQRSVFGQRLINVVNKIFGWNSGWGRDDRTVVTCCAELVLRALEKLEVDQI